MASTIRSPLLSSTEPASTTAAWTGAAIPVGADRGATNTTTASAASILFGLTKRRGTTTPRLGARVAPRRKI